MPVINSQTVANAYPASPGTGPAALSNIWNSKGGWFSVQNAGAFVQLQYGDQGSAHWVEEIQLGAGAFVVVPPNCRGMQFRNSVANAIATVTAQIAQGDEPPLAISSIGQTNVVSVASLNFQHGGVAVGTEPTLNFIDVANGLTWTVADNGAQTRVDLTPAYSAASLFATSVTAGAGVHTGSVGNAVGASVQSSGLHQAIAAAAANNVFAAAVAGDTQFRLLISAAGVLTWGSGTVAGDTSLQRSAAVPPSSGQVGLATQQAFYSTNTTGGFIYAAATNNSAFLSFLLASDANPAFKIFTQGAMEWGPGGASALDLELARVTNSPTGTGTFLELLVGAGFGYGTGTGGTVTQGTSRTTAVTLNKPSGTITTNTTSTGVGPTNFNFQVNNTCVGVEDTIVLSVQGILDVTTDVYMVSQVGAGFFQINYAVTNSNVVTAFKFNFAVIKGANS